MGDTLRVAPPYSPNSAHVNVCLTICATGAATHPVRSTATLVRALHSSLGSMTDSPDSEGIDASDIAASPPSRADAELVRRIRDGDERALEEVFRAHYAGMCAFVRRFVHAPDVAEELVQDVFFKLWTKREGLTDIDALKTYLFRAARNTALNSLRRKKLENSWEEREAARGEPTTMAATDDDASADEVSRAVQAAILKLPPRCREIFLMSRDGGLTYNQIAASLELSIKTVETQMGRALKSLRISLAKYRA